MTMLLLATALATSAAPIPAQAARAQATAMIRVVRAVRLRLDGAPHSEVPRPRTALVHGGDGMLVTAKLIEFE
jgi:hypothetical protein